LDDVQTAEVICVIGRPGVVVVVIAVGGVGTVAAIAAAGLGFKIEVVEGDGGGADNGQEDKAIGQEGGVHCYQAGGEVDEKQPWVGFGFGQIEVVGTGGGAQGQQRKKDLHNLQKGVGFVNQFAMNSRLC